VPIQPAYHEILFPDFESQQVTLIFLGQDHHPGNAIKLAYLCHAQTNQVRSGDIVIFYRSQDEKVITSLGIVEDYVQLNDVNEIIRKVKRRTVYTLDQISLMARPSLKVMLFRLVRHFNNPVPLKYLHDEGIATGYLQSIRRIEDESFDKVITYGQ